MPRTTSQKSATVTVRLPAGLRSKLEDLAAEREMNLSEFVRYAAMFYVDYTRQAK